ncbi:MAG: hypothetical protein C5B48_05540 [Candidatus Rokuibacteriota bacterium]|nr:MAG: hypothetical protein C5B48_05540 [Candidatus Rokubacteria bacterium]
MPPGYHRQKVLVAMHRKRLAQAGLIVLMVFGGLMLWLGNPVIWLWIGSHTTGSQQGRMGPYVLVAFGILASTVVVSIVLARLNRIYQSVTGHVSTVRVRLPWMRSLRGDEDSRPEVTVLDFVLVATAISAVLTFAFWFFVLAGSSLPGS